MKILLVCLGNICRSPLAEGILRKKLEQSGIIVEVDSAGTSGWHTGEPPHAGSISVASINGIDISGQRSRQILSSDLKEFDLILAMDSSNYQDIKRLDHENQYSDKIKLILNYVYPNENRAVPDPYYHDNFDEVYELLEMAAQKIVEEIRNNL